MTRLSLLGHVEITHDQQIHAVRSSKPLYLLLYLAASNKWIERKRLFFSFGLKQVNRKANKILEGSYIELKSLNLAKN